LDPATARGASPVVRSGDLRIGLLLSKEGQPVVARWQRAQASPTLVSRRRLLCLGMHPAMGLPWNSSRCAHGEIQVRPQAGRHRWRSLCHFPRWRLCRWTTLAASSCWWYMKLFWGILSGIMLVSTLVTSLDATIFLEMLKSPHTYELAEICGKDLASNRQCGHQVSKQMRNVIDWSCVNCKIEVRIKKKIGA